MNIVNFVKELLPSITRGDVIDDLEKSQVILKQHVIPSYNDAKQVYQHNKFQSDAVKELSSQWRGQVNKRSNNLILGIVEMLPKLEKAIDFGIDQFTDHYDGKSANLNYRRAAMLRYAEMCSFCVNYSWRLLNFIYIAETQELDPENLTSVRETITTPEAQYVVDMFSPFLIAVSALNTNSQKEVEDYFAKLPDAIVSEQSYRNAAVTGSNVDTLKMDFLPPRLNPIYYIRMAYADWQTNRYHAAEKAAALLKVRLAQLEQLRERKADAYISKEIKILSDELSAVERQVAKYNKYK